MSRAVSPSLDRVYGLARVTRCWNLSRATVYRRRQAPVVPKRRPGPVGPCDDAITTIVALTITPFLSKPTCPTPKICTTLRRFDDHGNEFRGREGQCDTSEPMSVSNSGPSGCAAAPRCSAR